MTAKMTSTRPYLLRAFYEWIVDNQLTPYVVINVKLPNVQVPENFVDEEGKITLNVGPMATQGFNISNQMIEFKARFSGVAHDIFAPIRAVEAVYAKENGRGIVFSAEDFEHEENEFVPELVSSSDDDPPPDGGSGGGNSKSGRSHLRVIK